MKFEFYNSKERKKLTDELRFKFGIYSLPKVLFETSKGKIRGFSGNLNIDEIYALDRLTNIEFMGLYLFKKDLGHVRLGFDCTVLLKAQILKGTLNLDDSQFEKWMSGQNLDLITQRGIYVIQYKNDFFGCGLSDGRGLINFVPKERRIRKS